MTITTGVSDEMSLNWVAALGLINKCAYPIEISMAAGDFILDVRGQLTKGW
jgi:hypothetical protein